MRENSDRKAAAGDEPKRKLSTDDDCTKKDNKEVDNSDPYESNDTAADDYRLPKDSSDNSNDTTDNNREPKEGDVLKDEDKPLSPFQQEEVVFKRRNTRDSDSEGEEMMSLPDIEIEDNIDDKLMEDRIEDMMRQPTELELDDEEEEVSDEEEQDNNKQETSGDSNREPATNNKEEKQRDLFVKNSNDKKQLPDESVSPGCPEAARLSGPLDNKSAATCSKEETVDCGGGLKSSQTDPISETNKEAVELYCQSENSISSSRVNDTSNVNENDCNQFMTPKNSVTCVKHTSEEMSKSPVKYSASPPKPSHISPKSSTHQNIDSSKSQNSQLISPKEKKNSTSPRNAKPSSTISPVKQSSNGHASSICLGSTEESIDKAPLVLPTQTTKCITSLVPDNSSCGSQTISPNKLSEVVNGTIAPNGSSYSPGNTVDLENVIHGIVSPKSRFSNTVELGNGTVLDRSKSPITSPATSQGKDIISTSLHASPNKIDRSNEESAEQISSMASMKLNGLDKLFLSARSPDSIISNGNKLSPSVSSRDPSEIIERKSISPKNMDFSYKDNLSNVPIVPKAKIKIKGNRKNLSISKHNSVATNSIPEMNSVEKSASIPLLSIMMEEVNDDGDIQCISSPEISSPFQTCDINDSHVQSRITSLVRVNKNVNLSDYVSSNGSETVHGRRRADDEQHVMFRSDEDFVLLREQQDLQSEEEGEHMLG